MTQQSEWTNQTVVVTGGSGFIGSHLTESLVDAGAKVIVVDKLGTGSLTNDLFLRGRVELEIADVGAIDWQRVITNHGVDVVFHLAANAYVPPSVERPLWDFETNAVNTLRLLEALRIAEWGGKLIFASSAAVYGNPVRIPVHEEDPTVPVSPYGAGKLAAERYVAVYSQIYGLRTASVRFSSIYGPRQRKQVVFDLLEKLNRDQSELFIHGDGTQTRDFTFVEDAVRATVIVASRGAFQGETYNIASGDSHSIRAVAEGLCTILDIRPRFKYSGAIRAGDPDKWSIDIAKISELGYRTQMSLDMGLTRTVEWYFASQARNGGRSQ
jgi:UDP-glucose 4-epimerase